MLKKIYAQDSEDVIVDSLLAKANITEITYLDIGASHPEICSNTRYFYEQGHRGVLVEPLPWNIEMIKEQRPEDTLIEGVVVNDDREEANLRIFGSNGGGSVVRNCEIPEHKRHIVTKAHRIENILNEHFSSKPPTFLSIDTEGWDLIILQDCDLDKWNIPVICAEADKGNSSEIVDYLSINNYWVKEETDSNLIFMKDEFIV